MCFPAFKKELNEKRFDRTAFKKELSSVPFNVVYSVDDPNEKVDIFNSLFEILSGQARSSTHAELRSRDPLRPGWIRGTLGNYCKNGM